jgi:hypothetical protein
MKRLALNQITIYYVTSKESKPKHLKTSYMKDTTLKQLVRDRNGQPRGYVVATVINDSVRVGWSYTNTKAGDRFDKRKGFAIALGRAENGWGKNVRVPHNVSKSLDSIAKRSVRYYKNVEFAWVA